MATPITWRTIAGPNFNNSALGQGIDAFRSAGAGFSDLTESLFNTQDRVDQGYTNEAIRNSLAQGQIDPNLNPRADSAAVWEALLGKKTADSDLQTADVERSNIRSQIGLRAEDTKLRKEQVSEASYKNSEPYRQLQERATKADITADEAATAYNTWRQNFEKDESERANVIRGQRQDLENKLIEIRQGAYQEYLSQNVPPGQTPTVEDERAARIYAQSAAEDPAARQVLEQYRFEKGYLDEAWDLSTMGERDALAAASQASLAEKRLEREEIRAEAGLGQELAESRGDLSNTIIRDGRRVPLTDDQKAIERMGSYNEALSKIQTQGINVNRLLNAKSDSPEKRLIDFARTKLPNASLLAAAIEPYIADDGELDVKGFSKVLQDVGGLTMQDRINRGRVDKGLPPIDFGASQGAEGATAADILGSAPPAVQSALGGIALNLIPSSLRPDAEEFLSADTKARASLAADLAKSASSSPIDKANTFVTLLRAYLNKKSQGNGDSTEQ